MARATRGLAGRLRHGLAIPMRGGMNRGRVVTELLIFCFEFDHPQFPIYSEVVKCFQVPDLLMKFGLGCFELYHQAFRASFFFSQGVFRQPSFSEVVMCDHETSVLVLGSTARRPSAKDAASAYPARVQA